MARHFKSKESLIHGLLKLVLLAAVSTALLFVVCRLYPEKIPPNVLRGVERVTIKADQFRSLTADLFTED